jgi:hypothetical protein
MHSTLVLLALLSGATPPTYPDGQAVIQAMHARYAGKWYRSLTFVQTTTLTNPDRTEIWYEAARFPGLLRIDVAPVDSGQSIFFRRDSLYFFRHGTLAGRRPFVHPLMVLGFDVYFDDPAVTATKLRALKFDLGKVHETTWQGRPAIVVGALAGDTTSPQFWVDRDRLVFVRMIEPAPGGQPGVAETQFNRYEPLGKGWLSVEVLFTVNGVLQQKETYAEARADVTLPESLFDPSQYAAPAWVGSRE